MTDTRMRFLREPASGGQSGVLRAGAGSDAGMHAPRYGGAVLSRRQLVFHPAARLEGLRPHHAVCGAYVFPAEIALANPLFNHRGVTMLFTINHLWYTLEAVCYGLVSGCSLCAVIMWFTCYQEVMTSDKFLYLFGKPFPGTSLLITMTLRFIPQLQQNRREIRQAQAMLCDEGTRLLQRLGSALRNLSVLLTMSMEAAV